MNPMTTLLQVWLPQNQKHEDEQLIWVLLALHILFFTPAVKTFPVLWLCASISNPSTPDNYVTAAVKMVTGMTHVDTSQCIFRG